MPRAPDASLPNSPDGGAIYTAPRTRRGAFQAWPLPREAVVTNGLTPVAAARGSVSTGYSVRACPYAGPGGDYGYALQAASSRGHEKVVQLLLDKGADVNAQGGIYGYALRAASSGGHKKVVQLLLDKGADVDAPDSSGFSSLAASHGLID